MHEKVEPEPLVAYELVALDEEGYDVSDLKAWAADGPTPGVELFELTARATVVQDDKRRPGWGYVEPSDFELILRELPSVATRNAAPLDVQYEERVLAAWYGRCAGCCLGKPVEDPPWDRASTRAYLEATNSYPLQNYIPGDGDLPAGTRRAACWGESTLGGIDGMPRDDDIDYSILTLHALEAFGWNLSTEAIAEEWLHHLPYGEVFTAERAAYRNLIRGVPANAAATIGNPYREFIGALIRGDVFGYVLPGRPGDAIRLAYQDAFLSHRGNGIYGELWVAALVSNAFVASSALDAVSASLAMVPQRSRLAEALSGTVAAFRSDCEWSEVADEIETKYGSYHWVHTINNAAALTAALLWGEGDFGRTIGLAVEAGLDTDSIGATAGSVFGALHGMSALPERWIAPLESGVRTAVVQESGQTVREFAGRTIQLARRLGAS